MRHTAVLGGGRPEELDPLVRPVNGSAVVQAEIPKRYACGCGLRPVCLISLKG